MPIELDKIVWDDESGATELIDKNITAASKKYGLDENLLRSLIKTESNYDPKAVSSAGAMGLTQLMPGTAKELGVTKPFDIKQNIDGGARYLKKMLDTHGGDTTRALQAYNAGPGKVKRVEAGLDVFKQETLDYVPKIAANMDRAMADALTYGPLLDIDPSKIVWDHENFSKAKDDIRSTTFMQRWGLAWDLGVKNRQLRKLGYESMLGADHDKEIEALRKTMPQQPPAEYGLFEKSITAATEMLPTMLGGYEAGAKQGLTYGLAAAGIAAIAGQAGPQVATPEEAITVPAAFGAAFQAGTTAGMMYDIGKQEAGGAYLEMLNMEDANGNKLDPWIIKTAASGVGTINALLEVAQIKTLIRAIPGGEAILRGAISKATSEIIRKKSVQGLITKYLTKSAGFMGKEVGIELAQESVQMASTELGIALNNAMKETDIPHATREEVLDRLVETAKQSTLAFLALGAPGASVNVMSDIAQQHAKNASVESIEDTVNGIFPGHGIKYNKVKEGFEFQSTDPESDLYGATFTTESLYPNEIKAKMEEIAQGRKNLEPENIHEQRETVIAESQTPDIQTEVNNIKDQGLVETAEHYEIVKDLWIGGKDYRLLEIGVEKKKFQDELIKLYGEPTSSRAVAKTLGLTDKDKIMGQRARDIDMAMHIYMDTKRNPAHIDQYFDDLTESQQKIVELSQNLPQDIMPLVQRLEASYEAMSNEAFDAGLIQNILDNYAARMWDLGISPAREVGRKFGAKTRHRHRRKYDTIIEAWATTNNTENPLKLKIKGATNNLAVLKEELIKTIEDKKFLEDLKALRDADGNKLVYNEFNAPEDAIKLDHPNLNEWIWTTKIKLDTESIDTETGLMIGDIVHAHDRGNYGKVIGINDDLIRVSFKNPESGATATVNFPKGEGIVEGIKKVKNPGGKNYFITPDGNVFERQQLYADPQIAKNLNNILGVSRLSNTPVVRQITKYNAIFKQWLLVTSLFHHLAFMRSFYLPGGLEGRGLTPRQAYKDGMRSIMALEPEIKLLVENGLTLGLQQEWDEHLAEEQTAIGTMIDRIGGEKATAAKQKILDLRKIQTDFLFGSFGAGLKAKVALLELKKHAEAHPELGPKEAARQVAEMVNNDFGGLHLQRLGRNPTLQHIFRLFALAPDWTESNVRTMINLFWSRGKTDKAQNAERELYRRFWVGVLWKGMAVTALANFALAGGDVDEMERRFRRAWKEGKFRWLDIDITPIYRAFGGTSPERKYFSFIGHFHDPLKFLPIPGSQAGPIVSAKHKGSVVSRIAIEGLTGSDWAGRPFTTLNELMTTGETVKWGRGSKLKTDQYPSFVLHELMAVQPIQLQQMAGWMSGETDGFDALSNSLGLGVRTTYSPKRKTRK